MKLPNDILKKKKGNTEKDYNKKGRRAEREIRKRQLKFDCWSIVRSTWHLIVALRFEEEKPSIVGVCFNSKPVLLFSSFLPSASFVLRSSFFFFAQTLVSNLPSLSAITISSNESPAQLFHAHKNPTIFIQLRDEPTTLSTNRFLFFSFFSLFFSSFIFFFTWRPISWLRSESPLILWLRPRGWVLLALSSRRLSVTSSLKASATSALKILAILVTVIASCRFPPSLPDAWCFYLRFYSSFFQDLS